MTWGCNVNGALGRPRALLGESRGPDVLTPRALEPWPDMGEDEEEAPATVSCGWGHTAVVTCVAVLASRPAAPRARGARPRRGVDGD